MAQKTPLRPNATGKKKMTRAERVVAAKAAAENAKIDARYVAVGSEEEKKALERLEKEYAQAACDMTDFIKTGSEFIATRDATAAANSDRLNKMWQRRLLLMCLGPLEEGLSFGSILQSVSMYAGLAAANPEIRRVVQAGAADMFKTLSQNLGMKGTKSGDKWSERFAKLSDKYMAKSNFGHVPMTAESAAVQHISLTKEAYTKMRGGEADPDSVMKDYDKAVDVLRGICQRDGVQWQDVCQQERVIVGRMCRENPDEALAFGEIMYDDIGPAKAHKVRDLYYNPDGTAQYREQFVWTGEYEDSDGNAFNDVFKPRVPLTVEKTSKEIANEMLSTRTKLVKSGMSEGMADYATFGAFTRVLDIPWKPDKNANMPITDEQQVHINALEQSLGRWKRMGLEDGMSKEQLLSAFHVGCAQVGQVVTSRDLYKEAKTEDDLWMLKHGNAAAMVFAQHDFPDDAARKAAIHAYSNRFAAARLSAELAELGPGQTARDLPSEVRHQIWEDRVFLETVVERSNENYRAAWIWADAKNPTAAIDSLAEQEQRVCDEWIDRTSGKGKSPMRESCAEANKFCNPRNNPRLEAELDAIFADYGGVKVAEGSSYYGNAHIPQAEVPDMEAKEKLREANRRDRAKAAEARFGDIFEHIDDTEYDDKSM